MDESVANTLEIFRLEIDTLAADNLRLEESEVLALSEAQTYREMLSLTLAAWALDQKRLRAANQRLRQVMGIEDWHPEAAL